MMERYGTEKRYNIEIQASFAKEDGVEILIVVDKLLVGFRRATQHRSVYRQTTQRTRLITGYRTCNRLFEGKDYGYIIDYRGVLGELNEAMDTYNALEGYDTEDVAGTIADVAAEIERLPHYHEALWDIFKTVDNQNDVEAMQQFLAPEDIRHQFYDALSDFARSLKVALSTVNLL